MMNERAKKIYEIIDLLFEKHQIRLIDVRQYNDEDDDINSTINYPSERIVSPKWLARRLDVRWKDDK